LIVILSVFKTDTSAFLYLKLQNTHYFRLTDLLFLLFIRHNGLPKNLNRRRAEYNTVIILVSASESYTLHSILKLSYLDFIGR